MQMATRGKAAIKNKTRKKVEDDSDEDYTVGEDDELDESENEYCYSRKAKRVGRRERKADYTYTISEEEREQMREGAEICRSLASDVRSSYLRMIERKEKEEMGGGKMKLGKKICGICLSLEGRRRRERGTLDCCSHYFCLGCILEWSEVESRCPICKNRFQTIRSGDVIIPVPQCDQVYQPSEEELRCPLEDALCSECHQGDDDEHMLLCDLCDSSVHTYCVGLGHEVPEGSWYCVVCRTTVPDSSNVRTNNLSTNDQNKLNVSEGSSSTSTRSQGPLKEHVQCMVRRHLKSFSRDSQLGYDRFKGIARRSTHTILAALGMEHRWNQVTRVRSRPLLCDHLHMKRVVADQCSSCLEFFIRSVVREVMAITLHS